jgi:hypothetical protein
MGRRRDQRGGDAGGDQGSPIPEILRGASPGEVLDRLSEGDPLGIWPLVSRDFEHNGWMLDAERTYFRALARTAYDAFFYDGRPELSVWLRAKVDRAIRELRSEQSHEESIGTSYADSPDAAWYERICQAMKLELELVRLACVTLNALPREDRQAFRAIALDGHTPEQLSIRGFGPPAEILERFRRATAAALEVLERRRLADGRGPTFGGEGGG